ncbi:MAG: class D sortase [Symbiobacteriia bacterium]
MKPLTKPQPLGVEPKQGQRIYRLLIPRIKVNNIVVFGTSAEALKKGPGHIEGTPFPWHGGNSAIAAHRDYFFWRLGELEIGDEVRMESELGNRFYKVTEKRVVDESNVDVLSPTGKDQITLITCWPLIFLGHTPNRLVITAERQ